MFADKILLFDSKFEMTAGAFSLVVQPNNTLSTIIAMASESMTVGMTALLAGQSCGQCSCLKVAGEVEVKEGEGGEEGFFEANVILCHAIGLSSKKQKLCIFT